MFNLHEIQVRPVCPTEEQRFQKLMHAHHYLKSLPKISETIWYAASLQDQWIAILSFSAAALKCAPRDRWIGWSFRHQYDRLKWITNNSRFLILPGWHLPNLASRILSLCEKRIAGDWQTRFGHPVLLIETFVDPRRFRGTIYRAANWMYLGDTKGFSRTRNGYSQTASSPKMVFVRPLRPDAHALLSQPFLNTGGHRLMLSAEHMQSLPSFFEDIPDPRRSQGRRHRLSTVLAIAAAAILCGMRGYEAIWEWANDLSQQARSRFKCRYRDKRYHVPSLYIIRDVLIRVDPEHLDRALQRWNQVYGQQDESLAIDGKTMRNAIDENGNQVHIMSAVGHESKTCFAQKKSVHCQSPAAMKPNAPTKSKSPSPCLTPFLYKAKPSPPTPY